jgi:hypothetical protein
MTPLHERIRQILESARTQISRTVNTTQVMANSLIGREIVEEEQRGFRRAGYGEGLLRDLAKGLHAEYGTGYNLTDLKLFRKFYLEYPGLPEAQKCHAVRDLSGLDSKPGNNEKGHALRTESWKPGMLSPNLSWTHYRTLLRVDKTDARSFYEIEAIQNKVHLNFMWVVLHRD